jgi:hypothetical protein
MVEQSLKDFEAKANAIRFLKICSLDIVERVISVKWGQFNADRIQIFWNNKS